MISKNINMLLLSVTGKCNLACKYCYAENYATEFMKLETAVKAIDMVAIHGNPFILQFSGGEPLLNFKLIREVIDYIIAKKIPAIMQIQTNATLITDEIANVLQKGRVAIGVSLDGKPQENDAQRCYSNGLGATKSIIKGIETLKRNNIEIGVTCVVTDQNVLKLSGIVEFAYYLGNIRRIGFDLLRGQGRGKNLMPAKHDQIETGLKDAFRLAANLEKVTGRRMLFSQLEKVDKLAKGEIKTFSHCHAMDGAAIYVDVSGDIYACASLMGNRDFYIGNVNTGINIELQENIADKIKADMKFCLDCLYFKLCGGACFARWLGCKQNGDYKYECSLKQTVIKFSNNAL